MGRKAGLADSEIMTVLVLYHSSRFKNFKTFYNGIVLGLLRACFPGALLLRAFYCTYEPRVDAFGFFPRQPDGPEGGHLLHRQHTAARLSQQTHRQTQGFHWPGGKRKDQHGLVFRLQIAYRVQPSARDRRAQTDTRQCSRHNARARVSTKDLSGKLFGDKGYIGQKLAQELLHRGLILMTRVRSNMKSLPVSFLDKALLNGRNIAETIIGHIKEFSSLRLPKHRSVFNAFTHVTAAIIAYQIDPLPPRPIRVILP